MSAKHTPGPWKCSRADMASYRVSDGKQVSFVYMPDRNDGTQVERIAVASDNPVEDARLMAAAPDMLEALKRLVDPAPGVEKLPPWVYGIVMPVLAKAEGRS